MQQATTARPELFPLPVGLSEGVFSLAAGLAVPENHDGDDAARAEKSRQGVSGFFPALHQGHTACNSTIALGLRLGWLENRGGSRCTGKERDAETGLDYFGARYYGSNMGRFLTPDWAAKPTEVPYADYGDPQSLNLYGYVRNNPLAKADADGHQGEVVLERFVPVLEEYGGPILTVLQVTAAAVWGGMESGIQGPVLNAPGHGYRPPQQYLAKANGNSNATPIAQSQSTPAQPEPPSGNDRNRSSSTESKPVPDSIPAGPSARPTAAQQRAINEMGEAHGCSTCGEPTPGTKTGNWVGDHQPPTALNTNGGPQVYKPQCLACSRQQGGQVNAAKKKVCTTVNGTTTCQ